MWMMPLHLHINQKSDYDDDDELLIKTKSLKKKFVALKLRCCHADKC